MRIRRPAAVIALAVGLTLSLGTVGLVGATDETAFGSLSQETTAAAGAGDASVTFTGCSAAQVSGDVDRVMAETSFYDANGVGGNTLGFDPDDDTTVVEVPGDGISGESLDSVTLYRDGEIVAEKTNPDRDSCWNEIRPEEPTVSFVGRERTDDGSYEMTYAYTNPNDEALAVNNEFDAEVSGETPEQFAPGTHEFTVGWSPEDKQTLTWSAHLGTFGYDTVEASSVEPETTTATADDETTGAASAGTGDAQLTQTMTPDENTPNESISDESTPNESTPNESTPNESTSDDGSSGAPSIEFTGCSAARVSGDADYAMAETSFYDANGVGGNTLKVDSVSGTTAVEVPGDGIAGETLNSVTLYRDGEIMAEKTNPRRDSCWDRIRPKKVDVSFVGAKSTGDGSYEMTYAYTNPNDEALAVNNEFDAEVSGETPEQFAPGTHEFTVEWSPNDGEELTWNAHLGTFGYDTMSASGSVQTGTTEDGSDDDGNDGGDGDARTDGGIDASESESGSDDSGSSDAASGATDSDADGTDTDAANDGTTTTTDEAAQGSSGANDSDADGGETATPTTTTTKTKTAADATNSAMSGATDGIETEITGGVESSGQPGMGVAAALLALVASTLVAVRRR